MAPQFLGITGLALANKRDRKRTRCHVYFELLRWENPTVSHPFEHRSNGRKAPLGRPFLLSMSGWITGLEPHVLLLQFVTRPPLSPTLLSNFIVKT